MYIIQYNDGRVMNTDCKAEAKFYAWLSHEMIICNVYKKGGGMALLSPYDFA
jgi:hypothetical protein